MSKYLIALDDGHGMETAGKRTPSIPELGGRVIHENEFNRAVVNFLDIELKRCGFDTLKVAPTDADTSLSARVNLANTNNANAFISIHYNAFDSIFNGYDPSGLSVHVLPNSIKGRKLGESILKYLKEGTPQKNRGIVENNFYVLRETNCPAILSENGFMDEKFEAMLMINVDFQKEVAREHAKGICDYFGVNYIETVAPVSPTQPTTPQPSQHLYRVRLTWTDVASQKGAYSDLQNALDLVKTLPNYKAFDEKGNVVGSYVAPSPTPIIKPVVPPVVQPTIKIDQNVLALQKLCNDLGVRDNSNNKLVEDGVKGSKSIEAISKLPLCGIPYTQRLATKYIQNRLNQLGYKGADGKALVIDGVFFTNVAYAIGNYQKAKKLESDKTVGKLTWLSFLG